jgi:hypothetical protein
MDKQNHERKEGQTASTTCNKPGIAPRTQDFSDEATLKAATFLEENVHFFCFDYFLF